MSRKVALVLSSGGARGLAHIGVIESLLENGYEITSISGSSIGSVVGAFYAAGKLPEYKEWVSHLERLDVFNLIDFTFSVQGFIKGEKVFKTLEKIIPDQRIEDLRIPFVAVTTDIKGKQEKVFSTGSMYEAIKASVAIPTVIKPVRIDGRDYLDGGVTNPIPVEHVHRTEGDILVVSNVNAMIPFRKSAKQLKQDQEYSETTNQRIQSFLTDWGKKLPGAAAVEKKLGFFDILNESIDLMQDKLTSLLLEKHKPDLLINISRECASTFEFYRAKELIEVGREAYQQAKVKI